MAPSRKERVARNESAFRKLNESLESSVHHDRPADDHAGFVCECGDGDCDDIVRLQIAAYEEIRQDSRLFFVAPGHEIAEAEDVVRKGDGYFVVRKRVDVAEIAQQGDPRQPT
jgi:hypothetical protein